MQATSSEAPTLGTLLRLGRVSNLPTVWTNVLAGTVLASGAVQSWRFGIVLLAMSLLYVGGMYLNDYFDRAIDAAERPSRPIPAGEISAASVAVLGFGMLGAGVALMTAIGFAAALWSALLALAIIAYDVFHKGNPGAPVVMGLCRALVYCGAAAAATAAVSNAVIVAALALLAYVAGLTYAARQESYDRVGNLWPLVLLAAPMLLALPALAQGVLAALVYLALVWLRGLRDLSAGDAADAGGSAASGWSADRRHFSGRCDAACERRCHRACVRRDAGVPAHSLPAEAHTRHMKHDARSSLAAERSDRHRSRSSARIAAPLARKRLSRRRSGVARSGDRTSTRQSR